MPGPGAQDALLRGQAALAREDWETARAAFEEALEAAETAEALDGLGRAVHFLGDLDRAIELEERAFALFREAGDPATAAAIARWLAFLHAAGRGNFPAGNGWMARAEALIEEVEEGAGHGWVTLDRAPLADGPAERERLATAALTLARRYGDTDLELGAMALLGEAKVAAGRVAEGMRLLDHAMAALSAGEVEDLVARSDIVCRVLSACEHVGDVRRAEAWLREARRRVSWDAFVPPTCRTHYGGILMADGRWDEAEHELLAALRAFDQGYRGMRDGPLVRLAHLRVRQGRLEEARRLLEGLDWDPVARQALAAVALGTGQLELAADLVALCLDGDPRCVPALELAVQIRLTQGDREGAADAAGLLATMAQDPHVAAAAHLAAGRVGAAAQDAGAPARLQAALEGFATLGLPLEAGRAQLELARALAATAPAAAGQEAGHALGTFERLGAARDADSAAALLRDLGGPGRAARRTAGGLTRREGEVLALLAEGCSNSQIAQRLVISPRTAEHHVASILAKLGLRSRAEAAAYAVREPPKGSVPE